MTPPRLTSSSNGPYAEDTPSLCTPRRGLVIRVSFALLHFWPVRFADRPWSCGVEACRMDVLGSPAQGPPSGSRYDGRQGISIVTVVCAINPARRRVYKARWPSKPHTEYTSPRSTRPCRPGKGHPCKHGVGVKRDRQLLRIKFCYLLGVPEWELLAISWMQGALAMLPRQ